MSQAGFDGEARRQEQEEMRRWKRGLYAHRDWDAEWEAELREALADVILAALQARRSAGADLDLAEFGPERRDLGGNRKQWMLLGSDLLFRVAEALDPAEAEDIRVGYRTPLRDQLVRFIADAQAAGTLSRHLMAPGFQAYVRKHAWPVDGVMRDVFVLASVDAGKPGEGRRFLQLVAELSPWGVIVAEQVHNRRLAAILIREGWQAVTAQGVPVPPDETTYFLWKHPERRSHEGGSS